MGRFRGWTSASLTAALIVVAGGVLTSSAASSGASAFVPIAPCRLFDTRPAPDTVGTRTAPLGPGETSTVPTWGTNGNCTLPTGATGLSLNVAIISPTADSFLTVFPADKPRPLAANLNWVAGQDPTPNAVTAALSPSGTVAFYNLAGTVHLAVDVVGYYEPTAGGPAGPEGPAGPQGPRGYSAWDTIPSGVTVTGQLLYDASSTGDLQTDVLYIPFPGVAPTTPSRVNFASDVSASTVDDDPTCTGTYSAPSAPPGQVCLYRISSSQMVNINAAANSYDLRHGFSVTYDPPTTVQDMYLYASWAYTAP